MPNSIIFPTWKTLILNPDIKDPDKLLEAVRLQGFHFADAVSDTLKKITMKRVVGKVEIDLVKPSVGDFGFSKGTYYGEFRECVADWGYQHCRATLTPLLRTEYHDQPKGEVIHAVMKPVKDADGNEIIYKLTHLVDDKPGIHISGGHDGYFYPSDAQFALIKGIRVSPM